MYLWNIEKLKDSLASDFLSQRAIFVYILIYVSGAAIFGELGYFIGDDNLNKYDQLQSVLSVVSVCLLTSICYFMNDGIHGVRFAERYFSILFVVSVRVIVISIPFLLMLDLVWDSSEDDNDIATNSNDVYLMVAWSILLYWRVAHHIHQVSKRDA